jgi:5-methylcytosine-specific restriction protein A
MPKRPKIHKPPGHNARRLPKKKRGPRLYDKRSWRGDARSGKVGIREAFLAAHPLCAECLKHGRESGAVHVDHVKPHKGDADLFLAGELQALCHSCHSQKTARENRRTKETGQRGG